MAGSLHLAWSSCIPVSAAGPRGFFFRNKPHVVRMPKQPTVFLTMKAA